MYRFWEKLDKSSALMSPIFPETEDPNEWVEITAEEAYKYFGDNVYPPPPPPPVYSNETLTAAMLALTQDL